MICKNVTDQYIPNSDTDFLNRSGGRTGKCCRIPRGKFYRRGEICTSAVHDSRISGWY